MGFIKRVGFISYIRYEISSNCLTLTIKQSLNMLKISYKHWLHLSILSQERILIGLDVSKVHYGYMKDDVLYEKDGVSVEIGLLIIKITLII
jgi:hypothetical protein